MTQILRFETNVPAEIALKDAGPGKPIEGRYGNRFMYTLADNRVMYVAPAVASRISDLGIQPGEVFQICKQVKKQGTQRLIDWQVERLPVETETQLERDLCESLTAARAAKTSQPSERNEDSNPQPAQSSSEAITPSGKSISATGAAVSNGSGKRNATSAAQSGNDARTTVSARCSHESPAPPFKTPTSAASSSNGGADRFPSCTTKNGTSPNAPAPPVTTKLEHALKTAISAAYNAEKYGAELGYVVRFDADAIKSMAITVLINMSEGNRR